MVQSRAIWNPPAGNPPAGNPPAGNPPAGNPPARNPPARNPPARNPPARNPPARNPPARNPPARNPPARNLLARNPPARNPPARNAPARNPPARNLLARNPLARNQLAWNPLARNPLAWNPLAWNPLAWNPLARNPLARDLLPWNPLARNPLARDLLAWNLREDNREEIVIRREEDPGEPIENLEEAKEFSLTLQEQRQRIVEYLKSLITFDAYALARLQRRPDIQDGSYVNPEYDEFVMTLPPPHATGECTFVCSKNVFERLLPSARMCRKQFELEDLSFALRCSVPSSEYKTCPYGSGKKKRGCKNGRNKKSACHCLCLGNDLHSHVSYD